MLKAVDLVNKIQDELGTITSDDLIIPQKFHEQLIGRNNMVVRSIEKDCGGVHIRFPLPVSRLDWSGLRQSGLAV